MGGFLLKVNYGRVATRCVLLRSEIETLQCCYHRHIVSGRGQRLRHILLIEFDYRTANSKRLGGYFCKHFQELVIAYALRATTTRRERCKQLWPVDGKCQKLVEFSSPTMFIYVHNSPAKWEQLKRRTVFARCNTIRLTFAQRCDRDYHAIPWQTKMGAIETRLSFDGAPIADNWHIVMICRINWPPRRSR